MEALHTEALRIGALYATPLYVEPPYAEPSCRALSGDLRTKSLPVDQD